MLFNKKHSKVFSCFCLLISKPGAFEGVFSGTRTDGTLFPNL